MRSVTHSGSDASVSSTTSSNCLRFMAGRLGGGSHPGFLQIMVPCGKFAGQALEGPVNDSEFEAWQADRRADVDRYVRWSVYLWPIVFLFAAASTLALLLAVLVGESDTPYGTVAVTCMLGALLGAALLFVLQSEKQHVERLLTGERHHREAQAGGSSRGSGV